MTKIILPVLGMDCASCALNIEKTLKKQKGVKDISVNFASEKARVEFDERTIDENKITILIEKLGYKVITRETESKIKNKVKNKEESILQLKIMGMDNPHCINTISGALDKLKGIISKDLLVTEKATIVYNPQQVTPARIKEIIVKVGYQPLEQTVSIDTEKQQREKERSQLRTKTLISAIFSFPLLIISMVLPFVGFSLPFPDSWLALIELLLATPVILAGSLFYSRGLFNLWKTKTATMDTLVALGTGTAYIYSIIVSIFIWLGKPGYGAENLYFEIAALLIAFILLGKYLEAIAKGKTSEAIKKLIGLQPKRALVLRGKKEVTILIEEVKIGDIILVKPGQKIPVDGIIIEGHSAIDESMITGESIPKEKNKGDMVISATINKTGSFTFRATKIGADTMLAQIIKLVEEAQGSKAPIQKLADHISAYFVPVVLVIALVSLFLWYYLNGETAFALTTFVAVLIIACPCALGLATPTAIMVGTGKGAEYGILFKSAEALQKAQEINIIVFDKTGTLTKGKPEVTDIISLSGFTQKEVLFYAGLAEKRSEHLLGEAIVKKAKEEKIVLPNPHRFMSITGKGLEAYYQNKRVILGNRKLFQEKKISFSAVEKNIQKLEGEGKTVMLLAVNTKISGLIAVADTLKDKSKEAVQQLHALGKEVVMITGDNKRTGEAIARQLGITKVLAEVLPADKAKEIKKMQKENKTSPSQQSSHYVGELPAGNSYRVFFNLAWNLYHSRIGRYYAPARNKVAMVGDGINDAPALAQADLGIAIGSGTDVAIESADIVLIKEDLRDVVIAMDLSKYTLKKIKQNLFWAFFYNSLGIPIAAGVLYPFTGWLLSPVIAGAAMAFSSVSVVSNSLLMKKYKPNK